MFGYSIFKVIRMSSVVRVISTPQNVNPETHSLLLLAPRTLQEHSLNCAEPFDEAQGERKSEIVVLLTISPPAHKSEEPPFGSTGNYKLPQTFTFSGLMTIIGR
jgi:hypothetical protein